MIQLVYVLYIKHLIINKIKKNILHVNFLTFYRDCIISDTPTLKLQRTHIEFIRSSSKDNILLNIFLRIDIFLRIRSLF